MTKEQSIDYCYKHKNDYVKSMDDVEEGLRQFECLIAILEDGTIEPSELPAYGMEFGEPEN